ncbi:hypothetical protein FO519_004809 [Halicephalobus sp. NKZ332]|nr:hypothetical protein FO519_004809 [Halicephalobus sp. NKZ332]
MGQPNDNEICSAGDGRPAKMPRGEDDHISAVDLSKFIFKEVLGGDPGRKSIFILIENVENKTQAILIMDKLAFAENGDVISVWLPATKLEVKAINDIYHNYIAYLGDQFSGVKTTIIYPCTEKHIIKYRRKELYIAYETSEDYRNITLPYIKEKAVSLQWVYNVLEGKSEVDRAIHHDKDPITGFLLAMDLKWSGTEVDSLYLQAIVNRRDIPSVRALNSEHLPLLKNIRDSVYSIVEEKYGLESSQIKMYFHYQPSYFHLHVHVINLKYEAPASGMTSIPLEEVISNLEIWPDFYEKATLMFMNGKQDPIMEKFVAAGRVNMLMFCPTCGRLTTLEDAGGQFKFVCSGCHFKMPVNGEIRSRIYPRLKDIDDVLGGPNVWENAQVTEERCPKCSHDRAYFMQLQTRSADEPMTIFYRCANVDCAHRWKD